MLCPAADIISNNIKEATERVAGKGNVKVIVTHTPPFTRDMLSEEAKLILNM
jgi:metal-sulfur cluster biosynthetic enzyme